MKKWGLRILAGGLLIVLAAGACLGAGLLALAIATRPTQPPLLHSAGVRRLNRDAAAYHDPAWSPDSRYLAYARANLGPGPEFTKQVDPSTFEIYIMEVETGVTRQLTRNECEDRRPSWSPDGTQIAFDSAEETFPWPTQIWVMNADGSEARQVTRCALSCYEPVWSPDGQRLLLETSPAKGEPAQLYLLNLATEDLERLMDTGVDALHAVWSPDGTRIAYTETDLSGFNPWSRPYFLWSNIVMVDADGQNARQLTSGDAHDADPTWAPSGRYLAFVSNRRTRGGDIKRQEILILALETGEVFPLLEGEFKLDFAEPAWSPDGRYIAFVYGNPSTTTDLYIAEVPEAFR